MEKAIKNMANARVSQSMGKKEMPHAPAKAKTILGRPKIQNNRNLKGESQNLSYF